MFQIAGALTLNALEASDNLTKLLIQEANVDLKSGMFLLVRTAYSQSVNVAMLVSRVLCDNGPLIIDPLSHS